MDFCQLLHKAQKNDKNNSNGGRYYSTKFEPPKKMKKESKDLSQNIKKFLAKKEAEEQKKREVEKKKKEELLALRAQDKKATRRVNVMLKRTKSANQSVIEDAVDNTHTAVTRAGPEQPDEDDYGYESLENSAMFEKMMQKYSQMPEEPKFDMFKKKVSTNLASTKDRVKAALEKEREEALLPHKRKRKKKHEDGHEADDKKDEDRSSPERETKQEEVKEKEVPKAKKPRPAAPPPLSFTELLKIAAQKQHEPILLEEKPQEEEKLFTKKQRKEYEREREWLERRERRYNEMENRDRDREKDEKDKAKTGATGSSNKSIRIPGKESNILERELMKNNVDRSQIKGKDRPNTNTSSDKERKQLTSSGHSQKPDKDFSFKKPMDIKTSKLSSSSHSSALKNNGDNKQLKASGSSGTSIRQGLPNSSQKNFKSSDQRHLLPSKAGSSSGSSKEIQRKGDIVSKKSVLPMASGKFSGKPKEFPPRDLQPKARPKELPPKDLQPKQFPPPDVRGVKRKSPVVANKGRIMDDSEEEYDSEMDDFIDDEPEEGDYSSYIKEIFGYDKSKYRNVDEDVDNMESNFAQQMREEVISTKLGIMEDLEDIKKEEEAKRRKALMKKKMKR